MRMSYLLLACISLSLPLQGFASATHSDVPKKLLAAPMTLTGSKPGSGPWSFRGSVPGAQPGTVVVISGHASVEGLIMVLGPDATFAFAADLTGNGTITATATVGGQTVDSATFDF